MSICKAVAILLGAIQFSLLHVTNSAGQWSTDPQQNNSLVTRTSDTQRFPAIIKDGGRGVIIAWTDGRNSDSDIYAQRIVEAGTPVWAANGSPLETAIEDQEAPALVSLGSAGFGAVWQDARTDGSRREIFVQRFDLDGNARWPGARLAHQINNLSPAIFVNNSGEIITAAYFNSGFNDLIGVQLMEAGGQPRFNPQEIINESAKGLQPNQPPAVVPALAGGALAAWLDTRNNTSIYVSGLRGNGDIWQPGELAIGPAAKTGTYPAIVSDGREGAIVAWIKRGAQSDAIVAARLDTLGTLVWGATLADINSTDGAKQNLAATSDLRGGAYLVWENDGQVYLQRVKNDGQAWMNDVPLASNAASQTTPVVAGNDSDRAVVAWVDARNSDLDIFAQAVDATGRVLWNANGVAVSTPVGDQDSPVLVDDGLGGAVVAWMDQRNGPNTDIYAQRVNVNGGLGEFRTAAVLAPDATDNWEIGSAQTIRWSASPEIDSVTIELSRDGGQQFQTLFPTLPNLSPNGNQVVLDSIAGPASQQCIIRVTAIGAPFIRSLSEQFTISETVGPSIVSNQPNAASFGDTLAIAAAAVDVSGVQNVFLNYRAGGAPDFEVTEMAAGADTFRASIPPASVTERGVEYFVSAIDSLGVTSSNDTIFAVVNFPAGTQIRAVPASKEQSAYRMVSSPNLLTQVAADSIFAASGYGAYDTTSWRLFAFRDSVNVERDSLTAATFTFEPGHAYWHISASNRTIDFGAGASTRADSNFSISLVPGWNQVGTPFAFPIGWQDIQEASGFPLVSDPVTFQGAYLKAEMLTPYDGYFIFNLSDQDLVLTFPPREFQPPDTMSLAKASLQTGWRLQIKAECGGARDDMNFVGIDTRAAPQWDRLDQPEPPPIGNFVSVYLPHNNWDKFATNYTSDFRPHLQDGQAWELAIQTNISTDPVLLEVSGIEEMPADLKVVLLEEKLGVVHDLREESRLQFPSGKFGLNKRLKLVIAEAKALQSLVGTAGLLPTTFELSQNFPNPFNPSTSIRFGLPQAERVTIRIFDLLGREVLTLVDGEQYEPGYHVATWNGRERKGRAVASGVYIYQIKAGAFSQTRKMVLVK